MKTLRVAFLVAASLVPPSLSEAEHVCRYCQAAAAGGGESVPKYAPDRVVDVQNIRIDVTPDFAAKTIQATTTITFAPISRPARVVELNAVDLRVTRVDSMAGPVEFSSDGEKLTLLFDEPIAVGQPIDVAIAYTAEPKKGLYFRTADMGYPEGEDHIWTQGETHEAPHWFPCFDYPNERSTTEVICHVPADMTVLSNGTRIGSTIDPATGLKVVHWRQGKTHVNYLVCLCAGYFHELKGEANGVRLGFYTQPEFAEHAAHSFQDTAAILEFFEREIGVPYPWDKYDQVTCRDYNWGGMENTSLTTLTHETIYSPETENLRSSWSLDAHELTHQWFGDYVTCKDWSHLWLNEGFATYYALLYSGEKFGRDRLLYGLYRDAQSRVLPGIKKKDRPIVFRRYGVPWEQFDYRAYPKGSWVLHMLRSRLGEDLYRRAVKLYLERHALSDVVTDDLRQAFEEVSGKPLDAFFDQWVFQGGAPRLKVSHKWLPEDKLLRVTVAQDEPMEGRQLYSFPVTLRAHVDGDTIDRQVEVTEEEQDFYLSLPAQPGVVRFDPEFTVLADVEHKKSDEMLEAQLGLTDDVIGRILAAEALGEKESKAATEALAGALKSDAFFGVCIAAAKALAEQGTDAALEALLGLTTQEDARVRRQVVKSIGSFFDDRAETTLGEVAENDPNPDIRGEALRGLAKYPNENAAKPLVAALRAETFQNQLAIAAAKAIGRRRDPALGDDLINALRDRRHELPGRRYGEALVAVGQACRQADRTTPAREFLSDCLKDPVIAVRLGAIEGLGELGDQRARPLLEDLSKVAGKEGPAAEKALERLDEKGEPTPKALKELRDELRELRTDVQELRKEAEQAEAAGSD